MSVPTRARTRPVPVIPPQHGAWAFLALPVATALVLTPATPALLLLAVAWITAYPASYFVQAIARDRSARHPEPRRFARPLVLWTVPLVAAGTPLLLLRPWLAWVAVAYLAAFLVNLAYARRRDERSLVNDAVFVLECSAMVPVTWAVGADPQQWPPTAPAHLWLLTVAVALVLTGSTLHVKSLIRERADERYARASRAFALASLGAAVLLSLGWGLPAGAALLIPFAYLAIRALVIRTAPRPARIGLVELVGFVLLVGAAAWAQAGGR